MNEIEYKPISREGYRVGSDGSVWSRWRKGPGAKPDRPWRRLKTRVDHDGYRTLTFRDGGAVKVSVLVLTAFKGERPAGLVCRHLDGVSDNDRVDNLKWGTQQENIDDKRRHGTMATGENHGRSKLSDLDIASIRALKGTETQKTVAELFGVSRGYVGQLWSGARERGTAVGDSGFMGLK